MNSNENDVLSETNIMICYMPKTELRMRRYSTMNMAKNMQKRDLGEIDLGFTVAGSGSGEKTL